LRAADADRHDGYTRLHRDVGGTIEQRLDERATLAFAFGKQHERLTAVEHGDAPFQRLTICRAASDRKSAERRQQSSERLVLPVLVGTHESHASMSDTRCDRCVE